MIVVIVWGRHFCVVVGLGAQDDSSLFSSFTIVQSPASVFADSSRNPYYKFPLLSRKLLRTRMSDDEYEYDYGSDGDYDYGSDQGDEQQDEGNDELIEIENSFYGKL